MPRRILLVSCNYPSLLLLLRLTIYFHLLRSYMHVGREKEGRRTQHNPRPSLSLLRSFFSPPSSAALVQRCVWAGKLSAMVLLGRSQSYFLRLSQSFTSQLSARDWKVKNWLPHHWKEESYTKVRKNVKGAERKVTQTEKAFERERQTEKERERGTWKGIDKRRKFWFGTSVYRKVVNSFLESQKNILCGKEIRIECVSSSEKGSPFLSWVFTYFK
jgi:hypothetical protein